MTQPTHPPVKKRRLQSVLFSLLIGLLLMQGVLLLVLVPFTAYLREQAAWQQQQDLRVESAADEIRTFVQEQIHQLDLIDSMPAAYFRDDPDLLDTLLKDQASLLAVVWLDGEGTPQFAWTGNSDARPAAGWYQPIREQTVTGMAMVPVRGDPNHLLLAIPADQGGTLAGYVNFSPLWQNMTRPVLPGEQTYVLNSDKLVMAHTDPSRAGEAANNANRLPLIFTSTWHGNYRSDGGQAVVGSAAPVAGLGWVVISEVSRDAAFRITRITLVVTALLVLVTTVLIILLYRSLLLRWLVRPMQTLQQGAQRMATGELAHQIPEQAVVEINEVSQTLNQMASSLAAKREELEQKNTELETEVGERRKAQQALQDNTRQLEQRIADRTIELTIANEMLQQEIEDRRRAQSQILYQVQHDPLTDLPNRSLLLEKLNALLKPPNPAALMAPSTAQVAILCLDLDHFQVVNDSLGHPAGDRLLLETGRRLEACLRPGEMLFHLGADEFVVLMPEVTDLKQATRLADHLMQQVAIPYDLEGHEVYTTTSVGIASTRPGEKDAVSLMRDADTAMYRAKAGGANRCEIFSERMHARARKLLKLEAQVRRAVLQSEFQVYYQPIVTAQERQVVAYESLIRWKHPQQGFLLPGDFLPLAAEAGLMHVIDNWMLETTAAQAQDWSFAGMPELPISVNISSQRMMDPALPDMVQGLLTQHALPPHTLHLEITESSAMENINASLQTITNLRTLGVQCWLDDFGQEYSSLSYLSFLPVTALKIPAIFIRDVDRNQAILRAIIQMAHALNLRVCAEGVETERQAVFLAENDCDVWQGFLYSPPLPVKSLVELVQKGE